MRVGSINTQLIQDLVKLGFSMVLLYFVLPPWIHNIHKN